MIDGLENTPAALIGLLAGENRAASAWSKCSQRQGASKRLDHRAIRALAKRDDLIAAEREEVEHVEFSDASVRGERHALARQCNAALSPSASSAISVQSAKWKLSIKAPMTRRDLRLPTTGAFHVGQACPFAVELENRVFGEGGHRSLRSSSRPRYA